MTFCRRFRLEFQQKFKKQIFIIDVQIFVERILNLKKNEKKIKKITKVKMKQEIFFFLIFLKGNSKTIKSRTKITSTSTKILSIKKINI